MRLVETYVRAISLLKPQARVGVCLVLANLAVAGVSLVEPVLFGRVIELMSGSAAMQPGELVSRATSLLGTWAGLSLAGICCGMVVALAADRMAHRARAGQMAKFFSHALELPAAFHGKVHTGKLTRIFWTGADTLFGLWIGLFRDQIVSLAFLAVLLPLTMATNWRLSSALVVLTVLFTVLTALVIRKTEGSQQAIEEHHNNLGAMFHDAIANVSVVQAFTRVAAEREAFGRLQETVMRRQFPVLGWWALVNILTRAASALAVLSIVVLGTVLHVRGQATVGEIVSFMGFAGMVIGRLEGMVWFVSKLYSSLPSLQEYFAVIDAEDAVADRPGAAALRPGPGHVRFEGVAFAYPGGGRVLDGIDAEAMPGETVALVGQTGAGKSTAVALLQRAWEPCAGRILVDGQDIRDVTRDSLRSEIGVVFQDSMLFNRSIRENLLVGRPDATLAEIEEACRQAEAHDFIVRQPSGYDTLVGERGATLSGGQKQRLAIARALLRNPRILILDEATSALDARTEAKVAKALRRLMQGRTTFVVAHRLSTVRDADQILVFEAGRVAERGNYRDLAACGGIFADLVEAQLEPKASRGAERQGEALLELVAA